MRFHRKIQSLTGRMRFRTSPFVRMVPQVEVQICTVDALPTPPPPTMSDPAEREAWRTRKQEVLWRSLEWRDATWLDLQALPLFTVGSFQARQESKP